MWFKNISNRILAFFGWIGSIGNLPGDSSELKAHKAMITLSLYACIANLLYFSYEYEKVGRSGAALTLLLSAVYFSLNIILFGKHKNFKILREFTFFGAFIYIVIYHAVMGGYIGSVVYINYAIPVLSGVQILYAKKVQRNAWYFAFMITAVILYLMEPIISVGMEPLSDRIILLTHINNFVLIASLVFLTINYYRNITALEKAKSDTLIRNILPDSVVNELNIHGKSSPIMVPSATVIFMDFVGFTRITQEMAPRELIDTLNRNFTMFDQIFQKYKVEKLKTIGDGYMAVGGLPEPNNTHPLDVALAAMQVLLYMKENGKEKHRNWNLRIGIHTGPMIAGIIGKTKFSYDVWGSSINLCSRLETASKAGFINVSEEFMEYTKDFFEFEARGHIEIKNSEPVGMYFLTDIKSSLRSSNFQPNHKFFELYNRYTIQTMPEIAVNGSLK